MDKSYLYQLLSAFLTRKTAKAENKEMDQLIRHTTDEELGSVLSDLWEDYELTESYDSEIKDTFIKLKHRIRIKRVRMHTVRVAKYSAIFLLPVLSIMTTYLLIERKEYRSENTFFTVHVDPGKSSDVTLPDGSKVELNSESSISYNNDNKLHQRRVSLQGEAHFKVTKNPKKPFIVSTTFFDVEVLGTTFNVKTYDSDDINTVALMEGRVKLTTLNQGKNTTIYLAPNQKAIYNKKTGELTVVPMDNYTETAWMKGILAFHTETLHNIKLELERKYNVKISMNYPSIEYDSFTGVFANKTLGEVLDNLKIHYGFEYAIHDNKVSIYQGKKDLQ